jgi:hypothetical protein
MFGAPPNPARRPVVTVEEFALAYYLNLTKSQIAGVEPNRGNSVSSDGNGISQIFFVASSFIRFCNFSRRSYDIHMTLTEPSPSAASSD